MAISPCKNCPDRKGLECKKACPKWSRFESDKKRENFMKRRYAEEKSAIIETMIRMSGRR